MNSHFGFGRHLADYAASGLVLVGLLAAALALSALLILAEAAAS